MNPLDWGRPIYDLVGPKSPVISLVVFTLFCAAIGGVLGFSYWSALGRQRDKELLSTPPDVGTQAGVILPVAPTPAQTPFVAQPAVHIEQRSNSPNSPNTAVVGHGNTVTINPRPPRRSLTKEQIDKLEAIVKTIGPHEIAFRHAQGNDESQDFADQLQEVLITRAGWKLRQAKFLIQLREQYGVWILVQDGKAPPAAATMLLDALNDSAVALGARGMEIIGLEPGTFDLMVGLADREPSSK